MRFSDRAQQLKPSATLSVSAKAQELKAAGKDIIGLSIGEPDFATPKHVCEAAHKAIDAGFTRYTAVAGIPELRAAAAHYFVSQYQVGVEAEHIIISGGGKHALYNIFQVMLNPGDHVLIPAPYWVSYPPMVELTGAKAVIVPSSAEYGFKVTPAMLEEKCTPKTRMLVLNSPSNPTGACYTQKELDAIAQWAVDRDIIVVADEIYDQLVFDGQQPQSLAQWWARYPEQFVIINGVAKTFAMTGWRIGYTLANPKCITMLSRLQGQSTSNVCSIAQKAAQAALEGGMDEVAAMRVAFERRRNLAVDVIATWSDVICPKPQGAFYLFPDVHAHYTKHSNDSVDMCTMLLKKAGVAVVPGSAFGDDRCIRISYAVGDDVLLEGLERIGKILTGK